MYDAIINSALCSGFNRFSIMFLFLQRCCAVLMMPLVASSAYGMSYLSSVAYY